LCGSGSDFKYHPNITPNCWYRIKCSGLVVFYLLNVPHI
jgi:hypothetical protein